MIHSLADYSNENGNNQKVTKNIQMNINQKPKKYQNHKSLGKYPIPKNTELFFQYSDIEHTNSNKILKEINGDKSWDWFSRDKKSEYMDEYPQEIKRL